MLTWDDVTGVIACATGGAVIGYFASMMREHWRRRPYHIIYNDDGVATVVRRKEA